MTEQELKEKIVAVFADTLTIKRLDIGENVYQSLPRSILEQCADALIRKGLKFDVNYSFTATFNSAQVEREHDFERRLTIAEHKADEVIDEFIERLKEENEISLRRYGKGIGMYDIHLIADKMKLELFKQEEE